MSAAKSEPAWTRTPPSRFDIATAWFPETTGSDKPGLKLRPSLIVSVARGQSSQLVTCKVAYGTKYLKVLQRQHLDLIIQHAADLSLLGLWRATRFDLDCMATLPWTSEFFGCWADYPTPVIGTLTEEYIRDFAYLMMRRGSA